MAEDQNKCDISFDLLDDADFLTLLQSGTLDDLSSFANQEVTATQVMAINTQQLLGEQKWTTECKTNDDVGPSIASEVNSSSSEANASNRKPLSVSNRTSVTNTNPPINASRFGKPVSGQEIREKNFGAVPKKTRSINSWSLKVWADWTKYRNEQPVTAGEPGFPIPEDIGMLDDSMLNYWGQRFIMEIKRKDGADYPPNTLHQVVCGLQRYLRNECDRPYVNFMKEGTQFNDFRQSLDTRMKELHTEGVGVKRSSSDPVTMQEVQLWENGVFNFNTSVGLSNAIFYYNGKLFGFRGFQEHVNCQASQFEIRMDKEQNLRYILFTPGQRKNSQGGLKGRKYIQEPVRHYEQTDRQYNLVELYELYLSLVPRVGPLYRKPLEGVDENNNLKFSANTISHYGIKSMMKRFFTEAGIDTKDRKITNHSARVSLCTTLYNKKFTDKAVVSRSKHHSNAVQAYQREQFDIMNDISGALEPEIKKEKVNVATMPTATVTSASRNENSHVVKVEQAPVKVEQAPVEISPNSENVNNTLVINVPNCLKSLVIIKPDGKKMILDI